MLSILQRVATRTPIPAMFLLVGLAVHAGLATAAVAEPAPEAPIPSASAPAAGEAGDEATQEAGAAADGDAVPGAGAGDDPAVATGDTTVDDATAGAGAPRPTTADGPVARPAPAARAATALSLVASDTDVTWGTTITLSGTAAGAVAGERVLLQRKAGTTWQTIATATTTATGAWSLRYSPRATQVVRAHMQDASATSPRHTLVVRPRFTLERREVGRTFVGVPVAVRVQPATWRGQVTFRVRWEGRVRAVHSVRTSTVNGRAAVLLPAPGIGRMRVDVSMPSRNGLSAGATRFPVRATARSLRVGARGADVAGLERRLRELRFLTPGSGQRFDRRLGDVVLAFHKSQGMARTTSVSMTSLQRIALASPMRPRFAGPSRHIEVDKRRQIMMVVRNGRVLGTLHVSTGRTGNTPEGSFRIYQKGGSYLYRFMAFVGNYGLHGYVPVPTYPASAGCVREPMWAAGWTYANTSYGDTVRIYR